MKVIIQIPCWNEEESLPLTFAELPRQLPGVDIVETLVIDDGSTDRTVRVARELGVTHVVEQVAHQGLARTFRRGLFECVQRGADIIVNVDADNQYCAADIGELIRPILDGRAEFVIGDRNVEALPHFSWIKKRLQRVGTFVVRTASGARFRDATSGFRAISRQVALQLHVHSSYTYTHETLIQAGEKGIAIVSVPVRTNEVRRPSRLFSRSSHYVARSANTIARIYVIYHAFRVFAGLAALALLASIGCLVVYFLSSESEVAFNHGFLWAAGATFAGFVLFSLAAVFSDILAANRRLNEETVWLLRELHHDATKREGR
jgi:glycosyltransferase involved in cell wall biosynthesis